VGAETAGDCDAVVLAVSGLKRLNKEDVITEYLDPTRMLPAPGQGALALEVRESEFANPDIASLTETEISRPVRSLGAALIAADHFETRLAVTAERALLRRLEAGCAAPIGAYAHVIEGDLVLTAIVADPRGTKCIRHSAATVELDIPGAERLGVHVAEDMLQMGAAALAGLEVS
jgi:hydroxymethylbilane synthase